MKLNFPSLNSLWDSILKVVLRFPLQVLVATAATVAWCLLVEASPNEGKLVSFIAASNLALTLLLASDLYGEANHLAPLKRWALRIFALGICTGLYFILNPFFYRADVYRIGLLAFSFHLLVAFAPFINRGTEIGFWQYNKSLFLRFLTAALYAAVLYAGLAIALVAIDGLFNVKVGWQFYMRLFAVVTAGFMTIFFLAGVPERFEEPNEEEDYPKGLKIFTQYVLIPLMTIYLLILLVYEVKIIISWVLPQGLVSTLILGYAVFGILSLLLIHPIKEKTGNGWIKLFSKFFYVMMLPLVVLLLLAVAKRVSSYGITESRYILIILAVWLSLITVYFLLSKKQSIKIIPVSLCILALLAPYGPQSAFSVSEFSQVARLTRLMASVNNDDIDQRSQVVDYLVGNHGLAALQPFTKTNLRVLETKIEENDSTGLGYSIKATKIETAYNLLQINKKTNPTQKNFTFTPMEQNVLAIKGYDFIFPIDRNDRQDTLKINNITVVVTEVKNSETLKVQIGKQMVEFDLRKLATGAVTQVKAGKIKESSNVRLFYFLPSESLSLTQKSKDYEIKLMLTSLFASENIGDSSKENSWLTYNGYLLIKVK